MKVRYTRLGWTLLSAASILTPSVLQAAESRSIEEVVVTAERKESSIQDTSISITAFTAEMMDDFGIRNQSDLQNLVPATTIQPYDSSVRGVGRNFRNLGGDPGVATYLNGIYSEDLYTATIQSFWDVERIEVLRGPQGTLYGRNAVGGAMNFLYKKPSDELYFKAKAVVGSYGTRDLYTVISGPLIEGALNGRLSTSSRNHDGWVKEEGPVGRDLDSGNEDNVAVQLEWTINDDMTFNIRQNRVEVDRVMGGANGGGLIMLSGENSQPGGDGLRNTTGLSNGLRAVNAAETNPLASGFLDRDKIDGDDLCAFTNGFNNETFDQSGTQVEFAWEINENMTFKYLFGYNDLLYQRVTDDDASAGQIHDRQFYVNHEAEYVSHEFQLFWDVSDNLTFTSGIFFYEATIDQRYDFYSSTGSAQFTDPAFALDTVLAGVGFPSLTFLQAGAANGNAGAIDINTAKTFAETNGTANPGEFTFVTGSYAAGDATLGSIPHGPETLGSDLHSTNLTERDSFAAYTQGVWDINDKFTFTFGIRYAEDEIYGEENLARYTETTAIPAAVGLSLGQINIARGAIDPVTLKPTGNILPWLNGVPITFGIHRNLKRTDDDITWRLNLDYNLNDDSLIYLNATTGYRSGGFNLAFFSQSPTYEPEELIAYEIGYKSQFLDNTLQFNGSMYLYDYDSIHTVTEEACPTVGNETPQSLASACLVVNTTASVQAAPGAEIMGLEFEVLWLATDELTIGGNFSYTDTEYTESFFVVDGFDPTIPFGIYDQSNGADRTRDVKGNPLPQVPEFKANAYATYKFSLGEMGDLSLLGSYSYIDDVYFSAFQNDLDLAPAYGRLDLRATWTSVSEEWVVGVFINNVTDEIGIRQVLRSGEANGFRRTAQVTEPRVYGLEVSYTLQ